MGGTLRMNRRWLRLGAVAAAVAVAIGGCGPAQDRRVQTTEADSGAAQAGDSMALSEDSRDEGLPEPSADADAAAGDAAAGDAADSLEPVGDPAVLPDDIRELSLGPEHACALLDDNSVTCWGGVIGMLSEAFFSEGSVGEFMSVSAGWSQTCAVRTDGAIVCWPPWPGDVWELSAGPFASVSAGFHFACGLRVGGEVDCSGECE